MTGFSLKAGSKPRRDTRSSSAKRTQRGAEATGARGVHELKAQVTIQRPPVAGSNGTSTEGQKGWNEYKSFQLYFYRRFSKLLISFVSAVGPEPTAG
jgi:hypothetical protein